MCHFVLKDGRRFKTGLTWYGGRFQFFVNDLAEKGVYDEYEVPDGKLGFTESFEKRAKLERN